jgi:hypothetical protein
LSIASAIALLAAATPVAATAPCLPDSELEYVCGLEKPEDVLALPGTGWLIASGFAPGAEIKLVDTQTREFRRWFTGAAEQANWDRRRFPHCPGPLDPALFNARGLSLRKLGEGRWQLLAVNHGGREAVEAFEIAAGKGEPRLTWRGCQPLPAGQVGNAVTSFADGAVLVTVLTRPGTTIGDFMLGRTTGGVWQWRPGEAAFALLLGTELPGNNGIEADPDQRRFYVVSFGLHAVLAFDRFDTAHPEQTVVAPDFMPDNIHWSDGRLLLAGMRLDEPACGGLRKVVAGVADPMLCHRGWVVGELLPHEGRIATIAYGRPQPGFNGHSAAAISGGALWLGSFQSGRLAIVRE